MTDHADPVEQARARRTLGEALASSDPSEAETQLRVAIKQFASASAYMEAARCFRSLGELYLKMGRGDEALEAFREGLGVVEGAA